jgi:amino acid transporter
MLAMGQDGALPPRFFGAVHPKNRIPRNNVLLVGGICLVGALLMSYQLGTELLNFGALLAFMGVNAAALLQAWQEGKLRLWYAQLFAICGFLTCAVLWWNLGPLAKIVGSVWAALGILLWIVRRGQTHLPGSEA